MDSLIQTYIDAGCETVDDMIEMAASIGPTALAEALSIVEAHENSTAMIVVPGTPPGKNVCNFIRRIIDQRTKVIVVAQQRDLAPGNFERLLRASMPDCEKKLRIMDAGDSLVDAINAAERNRHYRPQQALEIFCDQQLGATFQQELQGGNFKFDPTVISIQPSAIPTDDASDIQGAVQKGDEVAMHRVLDPHVFSDPDSLADYKAALNEATWPEPDILRQDIPEPPAITIPIGTVIYHGTSSAKNFTIPRGPASFTPSVKVAKLYADHEGEGVRPRVLKFVTTRAIRCLDHPGAAGSDGRADFWLKRFAREKRGFSFKGSHDWDMVGYARVPGFLQFAKKAGFDGIRIERLDSGGSEVCIFDPNSFVKPVADENLNEFLTDIAPSDDEAMELIRDIVRKNIPLLRARGVDVKGAKFLGNGSNGGAWKLRSQKVLKVTTDDAEANVAVHLKGKRFKHVFQVYDVWAFPGQYNGHHVYGLLTEGGLEEPDTYEQRQFDWMVTTLDKYAEQADVNMEDDMRTTLQTMMASDLPAESKKELLQFVKAFDLIGMMADMKKLGVQADLHSGNFMRRPDGTFVIIDIGTGGSQDSAKPPFMEGDELWDINVPPLDGGELNEFGTGAPGSGMNGSMSMKGDNSSSWSSGKLALKDPRLNVPEDENEDENSWALDWGVGRRSGASY